MPGEDVDEPAGLEDFVRWDAAGRGRPRRWVDQLDAHVVEQIMESQAPPSVIVRWLKSLGYEDATVAKVKVLTSTRVRL